MKFLKTTALALALTFSAGHAALTQEELQTRFAQVTSVGIAQRPALAAKLFEGDYLAQGKIAEVFGTGAAAKRAFKSMSLDEFISKVDLTVTSAPTGGKDDAVADFTDSDGGASGGYKAPAPVVTTVLAALGTNLQELFDHTTIATLAGAIDTASKEPDDTEAKVAAAVGQVISFATELETRAKATLDELKATHEAAAKIAAERDSLKAQFEHADQAAQKLGAQLTELQVKNKAEIDGLELKLEELAQARQQAEDDERHALTKLEALEQARDAAEEQRDQALADLKAKEAQLKALETKAQALQGERDGFEANLQAAQQRVTELGAELDTAKQRVAELEEEVRQLQAAAITTTGGDDGTDPLAEAQQKLAEAKAEVTTLEQARDDIQALNDGLATELATEKAALAAANTRVTALEDAQAENLAKVKALGVTLAAGTDHAPAEDLDGVMEALTAVHGELKTALNAHVTISGAVEALADKALSLEGIADLFARTQLDATNHDYLDAAAFLAAVTPEFTSPEA